MYFGSVRNKARHPKKQRSSSSLVVALVFILIFYLTLSVGTLLILSDVPINQISINHPANKPPISFQSNEFAAIKQQDLRIDSSPFKTNTLIPNENDNINNDNYKKKEFPYMVGNHHEEFETILHPGHAMAKNAKNVSMKVPKFWQPSIGREVLYEKLMTPSIASSIGYRISQEKYRALLQQTKNKNNDDTNNHGKITELVPEEFIIETIYVSVASYRDWQCPLTIADLFQRAKYPNRIRVAVIDQLVFGSDSTCIPSPEDCAKNPENTLCKYSHHIDNFQMESNLAVGPVFARHLAHRMYRGEFYAMQVDAHVSFVQDWDVDIVNQWKSAGNEMAILTAYLSDVRNSINEETGKSQHPDRPIMCNTDFIGDGDLAFLKHGQQPEGTPFIHGIPTLEPYWAAGFSFGRGHFVVNVPYDQHLPMIFQGEEISMGLRAFTYGYDFYTPETSICFHMYAVGENEEKRKSVALFWENERQYSGANVVAISRLLGMTNMFSKGIKKDWNRVDEKKYGMGNVRKVEKFFDTFGIHLEERTVEQHLCRFVGRPMQKEFLPHLRADKMGIDYDAITFKFKDPLK